MDDKTMISLGFGKEVECKNHGFCPFCEKPISISDFNNKTSMEEYEVIGLCQECQDEILGEQK